jgi:hypothetical protein
MEFFNVAEEKIDFNLLGKIITFRYPKAFPKSSLINVLRDFHWKNNGDVNEVPYINVTEYSLTWGQTITNFQRILQIIDNIDSGNIDSYLKMYTAKRTGFNYIFPHLLSDGNDLRTITNTWDTNADTVDSYISNGIESAWNSGSSGFGSLVNSSINNIFPGQGYEQVKKYTSTGTQQLTISFPLFNTKDIKTAYRNYSLVMLLAFQNLKTRTSFMTYIPPKLYQISNNYQGGLYIPVAHISKLGISSIGTTRVMSDYVGLNGSPIIIPEAYKVTIEFTELVSQSSNIFWGAIGGQKVNVIDDFDLAGNVENLLEKAEEASAKLLSVFQKNPNPNNER